MADQAGIGQLQNTCFWTLPMVAGMFYFQTIYSGIGFSVKISPIEF
jgi:hypothetical protein